jgi:hypothetical protein
MRDDPAGEEFNVGDILVGPGRSRFGVETGSAMDVAEQPVGLC